MELAKAIKTAVRFAAKGKDAPAVLQQLRFVGNYSDAPNWLHATDGTVGVVLRIDHVPDMVLPTDVGAAIAKKKVASIYVEEMPVDGKLSLQTIFRMKDGGTYQLPHKTDSFYPPIPDWPEKMWPVWEWPWVMKVVHAAAAKEALIYGKRRPDLECLHFLPDRVEATDTARMALAEVKTGLTGKVPAIVFKNWPAQAVHVGFTDEHAWFQIGEDEWRYAKFQKGTYASGRDLRDYLPEYHEGAWMSVSVVELREAINRALAAAPTRSIFLEFGLSRVTVKSGDEETSFSGEVPGIIGMASGRGAEYPNIIVDGKYLVDALKMMNTPRVRVAFKSEGENLRLESGAFLEALWQKTA